MGNRHSFKSRYGITLDERDDMRTDQEYRCYICSRHEDEVGILYLDHCHSSGKVRKMLCKDCNFALGNIRDNPAIARAMANYLEEHSESN